MPSPASIEFDDDLAERTAIQSVERDTGTLLSAALRGLGSAYLGELLVAEHLAQGRLVPLLAAWCRPFSGFHLYHPGRRLTPSPLRAFIDFVLHEWAFAGEEPSSAPVLEARAAD